jgi:signal transduction histidine kinase
MARELHDVVGHALTAIVVQAGAGERVLDRDPMAARKALGTIAAQGREALKDMDHMLGLLHGQAPRTRMPRLEDVSSLIDGVVGMNVTLNVEGDPGKVPASVSLTGYRIVQEALTNAMRHSQATTVAIEVTIGGRLSIRVTDDGVGGNALPGRGLTGMSERVELHRGSLRFDKNGDRGFAVEALIPLPTQP